AELCMPAGDHRIVRNQDIPLSPANDQAVVAQSNPLSFMAPVIEDAEKRHPRPAHRAKCRSLIIGFGRLGAERTPGLEDLANFFDRLQPGWLAWLRRRLRG